MPDLAYAQSLLKHSLAELVYEFDFSQEPEIVAGQTIASITSVTSEVVLNWYKAGTPTALSLGTPGISGSKVLVNLTGGHPGYSYLMTCVVQTSLAKKPVRTGVLYVQRT